MGNFVIAQGFFDLIVVLPLSILGFTVNNLVKDHERRGIAKARHVETIARIVEKIKQLLPKIEPYNNKTTIKNAPEKRSVFLIN